MKTILAFAPAKNSWFWRNIFKARHEFLLGARGAAALRMFGKTGVGPRPGVCRVISGAV